MQLLIEDLGLAYTVDPLGGSYYIESLTNQLEENIVEAMNWVDSQGGIVKAVADGVIQAKVSEYAFERQKALESGALRKVGVNCYTDSDEEKPQVDLHGYDEMGAIEQIDALKKVRATRNNAAPSNARSPPCARKQKPDAMFMPAADGRGEGLCHGGRYDQRAGRCLRPLPGADKTSGARWRD